MIIRIRSEKEIDSYEERLTKLADLSVERLMTRQERGLELLRLLRFSKSGRHPLEDRDLNFIEQVNQTFTYLVSLRAVRLLLEQYPGIDGFLLNLGTQAGSDIESFDRTVAAEVFAAVTPSNARKFVKDIQKVLKSPAKHKYVFFDAPGSLQGDVKNWRDLRKFRCGQYTYERIRSSTADPELPLRPAGRALAHRRGRAAGRGSRGGERRSTSTATQRRRTRRGRSPEFPSSLTW